MVLMFIQMRPKQWTKNLLCFSALIFSFEKLAEYSLLKSLAGFVIFCFVSSCVYILNDFFDREADRQHPTKRFRPMASGQLNPTLALCTGAMILLLSLLSSFVLDSYFGLVVLFYFVLNVAYSMKLKHMVIIDVMSVATGFVIRAVAGGLVIGVNLTPWFLLCTLLLSLFLAISKRRHEFILAQSDDSKLRYVLQFYNKDLLDQMNGIVTTATIMSYALFTFTSGHSLYLMTTIPLVLYGVFRYFYLMHVEGKGGSPDKLLFEDKHILITVLLYGLLVALILKFE
ncbi:decaprenyl-phosphate phosphoribosyltransferase [Cohnella sp. 56]|uniref:decaprenyl-phosphate phosphoribosyltransferase n=1 Tax=Cohnella sp. 56 TaxID=3113722 RepID=UPI0030E988AC